MKKIGSIKLILFFTALTLVLTWLVILGYETYLRGPFYSWVEARYPGDSQLQDQIEQRVEHFCISTTVDVIVVTLLLGLVNRQQRKLRGSEERYRALFEHAGDGIGVVTALDHRLLDANKKFEDILAYNHQSILGAHICDLMGRDEDGPRHGFLSKVLGCDIEAEPELESNVWSDEVELSLGTGSGSQVTVSASCSKLSAGKQQFFILIIRDLTERKRQRQIKQHSEQLELAVAQRTRELAEAHDFLNTVLDSSTEHAIIAIDTEGRVTLFNRGAELMFGYSAHDAMGKVLSELIASHFNPGERPFLSWGGRAEVEGRHQEEVELRRADQGRLIASVTMTPIRAQTVRPLGYVGIIKDLTNERHNEERLRQMRERLVRHEKIAALGRMAAQVAHEVKNPLAGLRLYSLHLKGKIAGKIPAGEEVLVDKIIDGIDQLSDTCEQVLSFARPIRVTPRPVDLNSIIAASLALVEPQLSAKKIKVELNLSEPPARALLDEAAMRSTLINLLLNSIQAMSEGGELKVSSATADQGLRVEIADTGCGMTEEQAKHMFEPFYTTKSHGLGLGLFFAAAIIEEHNGSVDVKSQAGKGTEITITLPLGKGKADGVSG